MPPSRHSGSHHSSGSRSSSHHSSSRSSSSHRSSSSSSFRSSSSHRSSSSSSFRSSSSPKSTSHHSSSGSGSFSSRPTYHHASHTNNGHRHSSSGAGLFWLLNRNKSYNKTYTYGGSSSYGTDYSGSYTQPNQNAQQTMITRVTYVCPYCDSHYDKSVLENGTGEYECPSCGGRLEEKVEVIGTGTEQASGSSQNYGQPVYGGAAAGRAGRAGKSGIVGKIVKWMIILSIGSSLLASIGSRSDRDNNIIYTEAPSLPEEMEDGLYVDEIGRYCYWDEDAESYYDAETDCYFWLSEFYDGSIWQYWYEGISSDYGDYGWMEYDYDVECWYIERREGDWIRLPDKYDTRNLWHFD